MTQLTEEERRIVEWLRKQGRLEYESPYYWAAQIEDGEHKKGSSDG